MHPGQKKLLFGYFDRFYFFFIDNIEYFIVYTFAASYCYLKQVNILKLKLLLFLTCVIEVNIKQSGDKPLCWHTIIVPFTTLLTLRRSVVSD